MPLFAATAILSCVIKIRGLFKSTQWRQFKMSNLKLSRPRVVVKPRPNEYNISCNITQLWCCTKCCTRLATLLYRVVSCCILLYEVWSRSNFSLNKCCTIQHFFCFPRCCMMLYSFGHPMQLCCTLLYLHVGSRSNFPAIFLCWPGLGKFFCKLRQLCSWNFRLWLSFLLFLICARLLVLQSFKMDFGEESEVKVSSCDGEGEFSVFRIFLKKCCIELYEMLHSFGQLPLNTIKQQATMCDKCCMMFY